MSRKVIVNGESICYLPPVNASEIQYDMGGGNYSNVQTELENLDNNKFDKIGGNISNDVVINKVHTSTSNQSSILTLGNNIASGSAGTSRGILQVYGTGSNYVNITANSITGDRSLVIPDATGTIARIEDIPYYTGNLRVSQTKSSGDQTTINFQGTLYYSGYLIVAGDGNGAPIFAIAPIHSATLLSSALENLTSKTVSIAYDNSTNILTVTTGKWCVVQILCTNTQFV